MINKKTSELDSMCQNDSVNERMSQWVTWVNIFEEVKVEMSEGVGYLYFIPWAL